VPTDKKISRLSYYSEKELRDIADSLALVVTLPVNVEIEAEHRVFDMGEVEKILRESENIFLSDCGCRRIHHNCDSPIDTCIAVNVGLDYAEKWLENHSHKVSVEEALVALKRSHDAGLVHMAYVFKGEEKPQNICSCCPCCCHTLGGVVGHGITTKVLTSKLIAEDDESKCTGCGKCLDRCVFGARSMIDGGKKYDRTRCFGCGLCVSTCPVGAIKLVDRKKLD
jgi:Pyruvate/2-oxoacid:ferredoxin oxidoreductase delta subunit